MFDIVCEPDEYARLVAEVKESGIVKQHRRGLTSYKHSFTGADFVQWYTKSKGKGEAAKSKGKGGVMKFKGKGGGHETQGQR